MRRHLLGTSLAIAVILTGATGCDNVTWGGAEVHLAPPPTAPTDSLAEEPLLTDDDPFLRSYGPLLLAGTRTAGRASFVVVGEVQGDSLLPVGTAPEDIERVERLSASGSQWVVFADGVRVGTVTVDSASTSASYCPTRRAVSGVIELVPPASAAEQLLALPAAVARSRTYGPFRPMDDVYDQRVATIAWAGEAIPRHRASWPADGLVSARQDIRVFQPTGSPGPAVAATFMYRDQLRVTPPSQGAYALFVLGSRQGGEYVEEYDWYSPVGERGKSAPRYFDHLDWDGDGNSEVLLEVLGAERRWFASLGRREGQWVQTFQDVCGSGPSSGG